MTPQLRVVQFSSLALRAMERFPMRETHVKDLCKDMKVRGPLNYDLNRHANEAPKGAEE